MKIVDTVTETPDRVATKVVFEDGLRWNVECEAPGCTNQITVGKRTYVQIDHTDRGPDPEVRKIEAAAPARRWCGLHPPEVK